MLSARVTFLAPLVLVVAVVASIFGLSNLSVDVVQDWFERKTYEWFIDDCSSQDDSELQEQGSTSNDSNASEDLNVLYATDTEGFQSLLISMLSVSRSLKAPSKCTIHIIVPGYDADQLSQLVECFHVELADMGAIPAVKIHLLQDIPLNLTAFKDVWMDVWPSGAPLLKSLTFAPMYLEDYLQNVPRVVWLSVNTIVQVDLGQLYRIPMRTALAAVRDSKCVTWRSEYMKEVDEVNSKILRHVPDIDARTLNSGVLVVDLERWKLNRIKDKLEAWVTLASGVKALQLALNLEFLNNFDVLDWRWNVMGLTMVPPRRCVDEARILHWTGKSTPWNTNLTGRLKNLTDELTRPFVPASQCTWSRPVMLDSDFDMR